MTLNDLTPGFFMRGGRLSLRESSVRLDGGLRRERGTFYQREYPSMSLSLPRIVRIEWPMQGRHNFRGAKGDFADEARIGVENASDSREEIVYKK